MNYKHLRYLDEILSIPPTLYKDVTIEWLSQQRNTFTTPGFEDRPLASRSVTDFYRQYVVTQADLLEWLSEHLPCKFWTKWQLIVDGMAKHKDIGRTECLNYIFQTGGENAELRFYDDSKELVESHRIEPLRWHWLDVGTYHHPINYPGVRWSLTVGLVDYTFRDKF